MEENRTNTAVSPKPEAPAQAPAQNQNPYVPQQPVYTPSRPAAQYQQPPQTAYNQPQEPQKSTAALPFNIIAMVIGIITFLVGLFSVTDAIENVFNNWYSFGDELSTSVGSLIFGLLGIAFAFIGLHKKENSGRSLGAVGMICGGLGLVCSIASTIILIACCS